MLETGLEASFMLFRRVSVATKHRDYFRTFIGELALVENRRHIDFPPSCVSEKKTSIELAEIVMLVTFIV